MHDILDNDETHIIEEYLDSKDDFQNEIHNIISTRKQINNNKNLKLKISYSNNLMILILLTTIYLVYIFLLQNRN